MNSDIVKQFNPHSNPNEVVFWSGKVDTGGADLNVMGGAERLALDNNGKTLEQTLDSQGLLDKMPSDFTDPATMPTWEAVSSSLADNATGNIRAYVGSKTRIDSVWNEFELPRLIENPNVTSITIIDASTGKVIKVYAR